MYAMKANFRPAREAKNGHVGYADITIGDAIRIKDVSVFMDEEGKVSLNFGRFGSEDRPHYYVVVPKKDGEMDEDHRVRRDDILGALAGVVKKAMENEKYFGFVGGKNIYSDDLTVTGKKVQEPYADGRYSLHIKEFVSLNGIASHVGKNGKGEEFVSVDLPVLRDMDGKVRMFLSKEAGKEVADHKFFGIKSKRKNREGNEFEINYGRVIDGKVKALREELMKQPSLDEQINGAKEKAEAQAAEKPAAAKTLEDLSLNDAQLPF